MKKALFLIIVGICTVVSVNAQSVAFKLAYNTTNNNFEVSMIPTGFAASSINIGLSQITLLIEKPTTVVNGTSITTTPVNGGPWTDQDFVQTPTAFYIGFQTLGETEAITNGTPLLLFTFTIPAGNCASRFRLFSNTADLTDPTGVGADFTSYLNVVNPGTTDYIATNSSTNFLSCAQLSPLPIKFLDFTAKREASKAMLNWQVAGEDQNASHYEIERSVDGVTFSKIATVDAKRQDRNLDYVLADDKLLTLMRKNVYYRVKQVDRDNKFAYSAIRLINIDKSKVIELFPNPAKDGFSLSILLNDNNSNDKLSLRLTNRLGQVVDKREIAKKDAEFYYFNLKSAVVSGDYMLSIFDGEKLVDAKKLIVQR